MAIIHSTPEQQVTSLRFGHRSLRWQCPQPWRSCWIANTSQLN